LTKFYTQLNLWQQPKKHDLPKRLRNKTFHNLKTTLLIEADFANQTEQNLPKPLTKERKRNLET